MHMYVLTAQAMAEGTVTHGQGLVPQGVNITLVVNASGQGWGRYPKGRYPRGMNPMRLSLHWENGRDEQLRNVATAARKVWANGQAVAVHCNNTFQLAPLSLAVLLKVCFGTDIQTTLRYIADHHRQIWRGLNSDVHGRDRYLYDREDLKTLAAHR